MQKKVRTLVKSLRQHINTLRAYQGLSEALFLQKSNQTVLETVIRVPTLPQSLLRDPTPLQTLLKGGGCANSSPPLPGDRPSQIAHSCY